MTGRRRSALLLATAGVLSLIAVWKIASVAVGLDIILPPPERVARETVALVGTPEFARTLATTTVRAVLAFAVAVVGAGAVGVVAGRAEWLHRLLSPLMSVVRATPVISVILLALIWFPTGFVPIAVALLMIVPIIYGNVVAGIRQTPTDLLEMAALFRIPKRRVLRRIYLPAVRPYVAAALQTAGGITWKVIVAAEVLAQPVFGIGAELQESRVLLATARVFAWTIVAVVLSALFHVIVTLLFPANVRRMRGRARSLRPEGRNGRVDV